mmetsp:Transcript_157660/g.505565  ORF Transcript_157660/g.505565 Transcript_157660/m.505565 type:complete len:573 (+) Transcript_157660:116-1834(+)
MDHKRTRPDGSDQQHEAPTTKQAKCDSSVAPDDSHVITLQLLCTNDTHSQMEPFTHASHRHALGGVARRAVVFAKMRGEAHATLTLDVGDLFTGQPFFEFFQGEAEMTILAALGYNATAVGNHDFDGKCVATGDLGIPHFKKVAAKYAPNVELLCANVVDERTGELLFRPHAVFEPFSGGNDPFSGIKVGVAAVLGEQAFDVITSSLRKGLRYTDYLEAARVSAGKLREAGCDVLVCLSHTGVDRGDRALTALGLYDVVFSGHSHFFDKFDTFDKIKGPGGRLGLLSPGFAKGGGICWARLEVDRIAHRIVDHSSGVVLLEEGCDENLAIGALVKEWRLQFLEGLGLNERIGRCAENLSLPDKHTDQASTFSEIHSALHRALRQEFLFLLLEGGSLPEALHKAEVGSDVLVITNRYSAAHGLKVGDMTRGALCELIVYNGDMLLVQLSGRLLAALVERNAFFAGQPDFLVMTGVEYMIQARGGGPLPAVPLATEEVKAGALECTAATVAGAALDVQHGMYWCIIDDYCLDTLAAGLVERVDGVRWQSPTKIGYRDLVEGYLKRGGALGSGPS